MEIHSDHSPLTASTAAARALGAPAGFALAVGPKGGWQGSADTTQGRVHGMDFGLVRLEEAATLTITVQGTASGLPAAFSFYQGWDTGTGWNRLADYFNNMDNPAGTLGLDYLGQAAPAPAAAR